MPGAREILISIIAAFQHDEIGVESFCKQYETAFNLDIDKAELANSERRIFQELFEAVAWYTPLSEDRLAYPGFQDEIAISNAVNRAVHQLGTS